ncbi:hypothetical protein N0V83_010094 [Neocucurbitaria cava]|uniref:Uncharacterized protein n=1 Tax=Neocucurbitaria cava TaxID=798079 RepID=A0A9W8Y089_9PLEO|nr:hypothetical protein N0V83_010094 [Neocucurbitaria cava]
MHRTPRFTRSRSWIGKERPLSRYQTLDNSEGGQELDNLDNTHGTGTDGTTTTTARSEIRVHDWPTAPLPLQRVSKVDRFCAILLLLFPIPFIVLVITATALNNKPLSEGGEDVFRLMRLGPTVYPLVFASVAGATLRTIALWKAERGTTVGTLEKLLGSHTFVHAIENAVALRSLNVLTLSLLALWALSPIGGQGSLRLMYEANSTQITEGVPMVYTKPDLTVPHIRDASTETWAGIVPRFEIDHIISASLTVSDAWRNNSVDPWGRPKIPVLKDIRDMVADNDHDWVDITPGVDTNFASLVGVGIPGFNTTLTQGETLNFTAPFEYLDSSYIAIVSVKFNRSSHYAAVPEAKQDWWHRTHQFLSIGNFTEG